MSPHSAVQCPPTDTQFAFGLTFPTPGTFFSTGGSPPFIPDVLTPTDSNEPYTEWLDFVLSQKTLPQTISTSYADDEQTGMFCAFCGEAEKVDIFASSQSLSASPSASATDLHSSVSRHA